MIPSRQKKTWKWYKGHAEFDCIVLTRLHNIVLILFLGIALSSHSTSASGVSRGVHMVLEHPP